MTEQELAATRVLKFDADELEDEACDFTGVVVREAPGEICRLLADLQELLLGQLEQGELVSSLEIRTEPFAFGMLELTCAASTVSGIRR